MKSLTTILTALALATSLASAAVETTTPDPAKTGEGKRQKADPEAAYKKFDTDANGALSWEEFKNSPRGKKNPDKAEANFKKKDANNDGALSLDEFKAAPKGGKKKKQA